MQAGYKFQLDPGLKEEMNRLEERASSNDFFDLQERIKGRKAVR